MGRLTRAITPDEVAAFYQAGVVLLRDVLDLRTVNNLRRLIDEATETLAESPAGYDLTAITTAAETRNDASLAAQSTGQYDIAGIVEFIHKSGHPLLLDGQEAKGSFLLDTGVAARKQGFKQHCVSGAFPDIAGTLLGSAEVHFFGDQIFVKEPQTREKTAFHQDAPYFEIEGEDCCVLWVPVDAVTARTGGMKYIRGSHRGKVYAPNLFISEARMPGSEGELLTDIDAHPERYDIVAFDVEPGDVLVHHYQTIHGTGGNLSRYQVRRAASLRYCGDDIRYIHRPGTPRQLHHTHQLQDGDRLGGPDFPVVWRRPKGADAA